MAVWERVTYLGDSKIVFGLGLFGFLEAFLCWLKKGTDPQTRQEKKSVASWVGIPVAAGTAFCLKEMVRRPRPSVLLHGVRQLSMNGSFSFPSGHATNAFALATALSMRWPRGRLFFFTLAALVAVSRVALGKHWPSDVLGGALVGCTAVMVCHWMGQIFFSVRERNGF